MTDVTLTTCKECIDEIGEKVERIDHALRGNGREGLITTVALLDRRVSEFEEFARELKSLRRWLIGGMVTFMASLIWRSVEIALYS